MNNRWLTYGNRFCAIEHSIDNSIHVLQLTKKKGELTLLNQQSFSTFDAVADTLSDQKHAFLIVNNEQILSKSIDFKHATKEKIIKAAFPNVQLQDFYFEIFENEGLSTVAICRKKVIDDLIDQYREKGISIIHFSLGNLTIASLAPFVEQSQLQTSNAVISLKEHQIVSIEKKQVSSADYEINGLEVAHTHILALAGIIRYFSGALSDNPFQNSLFKEYRQKRFFTLGVRVALGFLFISLLCNFLLFSSFNNQVSTLTSELSMNESYKKQLIRLKEVVSRKEKLMENMQSASNSKVIWYVEQIAKTVPTTLSLSKLSYQPLQRSIREEKQLFFEEGQMFVSGRSKDDIDFTQWVRQLEQFPWVENISFLNYGSKKTKRTSFDFVIQFKQKGS